MRIEQTTAWIAGLGAAAGAAIMYLLDPQQGRRRRAVVRDKAKRYGRKGGKVVARASRDVANRTRGTAIEAKKRWQGEQVPDGVLVDRVRAEMGHVLDQPSAVLVSARGGQITLSGAVKPGEPEKLLQRVAEVQGVVGVENRLDVDESAGEHALH